MDRNYQSPRVGGEPGDDPQRYYTGLRTRENTLEYAVAAGILALAFKECQSCDISHYNKWKESAEKTYNWGIKEENKCVYSFQYKGESYTYREPPVEDQILSRASLIMHKLSDKDPKYEQYIFKNKASSDFNLKYHNGMSILETSRGWNLFPTTFFLEDSDFDVFFQKVRLTVSWDIGKVINFQNYGTVYTYKNAGSYNYTHQYYESLGWSLFRGADRIEQIVIGLYIYEYYDPNSDYGQIYQQLLQMLSYYYDFNLGCNHYGRTFTTGLGKIFPWRLTSGPNSWFQQHDSWDSIPGISLYFFNGQMDNAESATVQTFFLAYDDYRNFKGVKMYPSPFFYNSTNLPQDGYEAKNMLKKVIPFWHRDTNIELNTIAHSEFTVTETISRMILMTGFLLDKDEKEVTSCNSASDCPSIFPTNEMKNKAPQDISKSLII